MSLRKRSYSEGIWLHLERLSAGLPASRTVRCDPAVQLSSDRTSRAVKCTM